MASKKPTPKKTGVYNLDTIASKAAMKRVKKKTTTERKLTGGRTLGGTNEPTPQSKDLRPAAMPTSNAGTTASKRKEVMNDLDSGDDDYVGGEEGWSDDEDAADGGNDFPNMEEHAVQAEPPLIEALGAGAGASRPVRTNVLFAGSKGTAAGGRVLGSTPVEVVASAGNGGVAEGLTGDEAATVESKGTSIDGSAE